MKRLVAFLGIALIMLGVRFYDVGVFRYLQGYITVYNNHTPHVPDLFYVSDLPYRIDYVEQQDIDLLFKRHLAQVVKTEMNGRLVYAYSPLINKAEWLGGVKFNMMIYTSKAGKISVGVPILMGTY